MGLRVFRVVYLGALHRAGRPPSGRKTRFVLLLCIRPLYASLNWEFRLFRKGGCSLLFVSSSFMRSDQFQAILGVPPPIISRWLAPDCLDSVAGWRGIISFNCSRPVKAGLSCSCFSSVLQSGLQLFFFPPCSLPVLVVAFIARPVSATGQCISQVTRGLFISIMVGAVGARGVQPSGLSPLPPLRRHTS